MEKGIPNCSIQTYGERVRAQGRGGTRPYKASAMPQPGEREWNEVPGVIFRAHGERGGGGGGGVLALLLRRGCVRAGGADLLSSPLPVPGDS